MRPIWGAELKITTWGGVRVHKARLGIQKTRIRSGIQSSVNQNLGYLGKLGWVSRQCVGKPVAVQTKVAADMLQVQTLFPRDFLFWVKCLYWKGWQLSGHLSASLGKVGDWNGQLFQAGEDPTFKATAWQTGMDHQVLPILEEPRNITIPWGIANPCDGYNSQPWWIHLSCRCCISLVPQGTLPCMPNEFSPMYDWSKKDGFS